MGSLAAPLSLDSADRSAYEQALARLYSRTAGIWKLGLERVETFRAAVGRSELPYPIFHVAGTNGKGSTVATLATLLQGAGLKVGRYTSPHLVDFRERIMVNGVPISESAVVSWLGEWDALAVELGATFFETTTVMALDYFSREQVDVAVIEVGLGGRLDATNVVRPIAAGITQIGFDHREFLGDTLEQIATEKAGIFKRGAAAVIGERNEEVRDFLAGYAAAAGCRPIVTARDWQVSDIQVSESGTGFRFKDPSGERWIRTPLVGDFQAHNTATALAMLDAAGGIFTQIASSTAGELGAMHLAGRFQHRGRFLFDVAHNADGARALAANLRLLRLPRPLAAVVMALNDKDWHEIVTELSSVADQIVVSLAPTTPEARKWDLSEVRQWAESANVPVVIEAEFDAALSKATADGATVLITGSFHTVGDAMARLQVDPLFR